jgi:hypothetical protein
MIAFLILFLHVLVSPFKTQARLEAEIVLLRHQLSVLRRQRQPLRPKLTVADRLLFVWLYRFFPSALNAVTIIQPETVIRWHRTGFRLYWRWKSRSCGGRPKIPGEIRRLIREMSLANRLWGAPQSLAGNTTSLADLPSEQNFGLLGAHAFDYVRRIGCEFVFDHVQTPLFAERIQLAPDTASPMLSTPPSTTCR